MEKDWNPSLSTSKSDKTEGENQLPRVRARLFVRLIWTVEDYSWMGGRLWKDKEDGNTVIPALWDQKSVKSLMHRAPTHREYS